MASGIFLSIPSSHTTSLLELLIYFSLIDIFFFQMHYEHVCMN